MEHIALKSLLNQMSTREKLAQLTQLTPACFGHDCAADLTGPDAGLRVAKQDEAHIGSVLNCAGARQVHAIQQAHLEHDPYKIPLIFMADIIHGYKTIFPIPLALACSFAPDLAEQACHIAAAESAASGIHVTFSPMADLVRDPRWGRVLESSGEDTLLNARMAAASVRGYQGRQLADEGSIAACVKHFAAYGAPEGGREYNNVELSEGTLEEFYLPAYRAAIEAGAQLVMASFNTLDRTPLTANQRLLGDVLRGQWGFEGCVISDYNAVDELLYHGVAKNGSEAAQKALAAGLDIEMMSTHFINNGEALLQAGEITSQQLDVAVMRVLQLKNALGLFEDPFKGLDPEKEKELHLCTAHRQAARSIARSCPVLLKNEQAALPLAETEVFGLVGPFAASTQVVGAWSAGTTDGVSLYEGLAAQAGHARIRLAAIGGLGSLLDGCRDIEPFDPDALKQALASCQKVIVAVGENQNDTGEGASKTALRLTPNQEALLHAVKALGKTVIAVVFSGRPLEIEPILPSCDALLQAWFLGTESGNALADLLLGRQSPSGKLSMSVPHSVGQVPVYYNHFPTGRPQQPGNFTRYASRYLDCPNEPLFPFGFGLTYSRCALATPQLVQGNGLCLQTTITNNGAFACTETIQLYVHQRAATISRPVKALADFCRVDLAPGQIRPVAFELTQAMLCYPVGGSDVFEPGDFVFMLGTDSQQLLCTPANITQAQYDQLKRSRHDLEV